LGTSRRDKHSARILLVENSTRHRSEKNFRAREFISFQPLSQNSSQREFDWEEYFKARILQAKNTPRLK
jgi:hypothetical protein